MESTPLLFKLRGSSPDAPVKSLSIFRQEVSAILDYAAPACVSQLLEYSLFVVEVVSVGHISTDALAAASLGSMTSSVTGYCVVQGLTSALDTLLPSAFTSPQPQIMGLWTQRMAVVIFFTMIPILTIWLNAEMLLIWIRQEPEIARLAALYLRGLSFGLPAYGFNCIARRYFQSQGQFSAQTRINICVAPFNLLLNYLLVWGPDSTRLGFIGAPISSSISLYLVSLLSLIQGVYYTPKTGWHPISLKMFSNLGLLLRLGVAGICQTASEWWAWEILTLAASFLGPLPLATQSILITTSSTTYQLFYALSSATSIRVGNLLGQRNAERASVASTASIVIASMLSLFTCTMYMTFRDVWGYMFSYDEEVIATVASVLPVIAVYQVFEGNSSVNGGILRAKGQQTIGALLNISAYYILGLPFGIWLAFSWHMDLPGLWWGMVAALAYSSFIGMWLCHTTDWDVEVCKVAQRIAEDEHSRDNAPGNLNHENTV